MWGISVGSVPAEHRFRELCEFSARGCSSVNSPEPAANVSYLCLKNTQGPLGGEAALSSQERVTGQGALFFSAVWALLSLLSAFPLLGAGLPQSRALPKPQSLLPAAIKGALAAVIQEMAVLLFLERGLETGGAQVRRAARAAAAPGKRALGIWLCPGLELLFAQPGAACSEPSAFLLDEHGLEHSARVHLLCWAAWGCAEQAQRCPGHSSPSPLRPGTISCGMGRMGAAPLIPDWDGGMIARKNSWVPARHSINRGSIKLEKTSKVVKSNRTVFEYIWCIFLSGLL